MTTKRKTHSTDSNAIAFRIVQQATGQAPDVPAKNPAAVSLGRLGGLKGGPARARKLTAKQRAAIAQMAAKKRWKKHKKAARKPA